MKYSIIIPVYNRPDEVDELLESLTHQSETDFEVVVVEDGSAVPCQEVCEKYAQQLNIQYFTKPNSGPGQTRNYGVERAHGDYVLILDSDVVLPEGYLAAVSAELQREPADAFGGPDSSHPSFTDTQKAISYSMTSFFTTGGIRGGKKKLDKFYPRSFNMGVRRDRYMELGGFSKMRFGEDIDFSIRIFKAGLRCRLFPEAWVAQAPDRPAQVLPTGVQLGHRTHQSLQEISRVAETGAHAADGVHRGRTLHARALHRAARTLPHLGVAATRAARALLAPHLHRLGSPQPQLEDWCAEHRCCLCAAHGLRLRLHRGMVETLRTR